MSDDDRSLWEIARKPRLLDLIATVALVLFVQQAQLEQPSPLIVGACVTLALTAAGVPRVIEWARRDGGAKDGP